MKAVGHFPLPVMTWSRLVLVVVVALTGFGCKPKIGEDCATSVDCSISGDRLCDITLPGGYCTVFNCEPNLCPDEAACVAFTEGTCSAPSVSTRFRRTFCMRTCKKDNDCRSGYQCIDISLDESRHIVDNNPPTQRICALPSLSSIPTAPDPPVCFPSDASFDVSRPETGPPRGDAEVDADVAETAPLDGSPDQGDSNVTEGGDAAADDVLDSTPVEAGADVTFDALDDAGDAAEETTSD